MALIGTLVSFTPASTIVSADVNSNFSDIRTAVNNTALMTDVARTVAVTNVWSVGQTFSGGATFGTGITVATGGIVVTAGGVAITAGNLGVGVAIATNIQASIQGTSGTDTVQYGGFIAPLGVSTTTNLRVWAGQVKTQASAFTVTDGIAFLALDASKGAGSSITNQYGVYVSAPTQGTNNYGVLINQGAVTGNALRISQAAATTDDCVKILAGSLTGTTAKSLFHISQLWNTTGAPTAILCNVTNTASDAASILLDLQRSGTSKFKVGIAGAVTVNCTAAGTAATDGIEIGASTGNGMWISSATVLKLGAQGSTLLTLDGTHPDVVTVGARFVISAAVNKVLAGATLATSATVGYVYIQTVAATATGVPATETGGVAMAYDSAANRLMIYNGSWRSVAVT